MPRKHLPAVEEIEVIPQKPLAAELIGMLETATDSELKEFASGAKRSAKKPRYDLISLDLLQRVAKVWETGAAKYGVYNWQKGGNDPEFLIDITNHIVEHVYLHMSGDASEDHLAHSVCGLQMIMHFQKHS